MYESGSVTPTPTEFTVEIVPLFAILTLSAPDEFKNLKLTLESIEIAG